MDELSHSWAVLQLRPGSDIEEVRSSYRRLVRVWHPDRYANDPRGQAEAAIQMRVLNAAYRRLLEAAAHQPVRLEPSPAARPAGRRLSREEIDRLVAAIGTESWIESAVSAVPFWHVSEWFRFNKSDSQWAITPSVAFALVYLAGFLVMAIFEWSGHPLPKEGGRYIGLGSLVFGGVVAYFVLRRQQS